MNEEINSYLWDFSGAPDPEIERLENLLTRYRYGPRPIVLKQPKHVFRWAFGLAGAAALAFLVFAFATELWLLIARPGEISVSSLSGEPRIAGAVLSGTTTLAPGSLLETDAHSRAQVRFGLLGRFEVLPGTRLRVTETGSRRQRLHLEQGKISARLWAPPFTFIVDTPIMTAYDLGCVFTLEVDQTGQGLLRVASGWVQIEFDASEELVPGGAVAEARRGFGPGIPYYEDSPQALRLGLRKLNFETLTPEDRETAVKQVLASARKRDVMTLVRLMHRLPVSERGAVFDRAAELLPPPAGVTRAGVMRGDSHMLNLWWRELGLRNVKNWWIYWRDVFPR